MVLLWLWMMVIIVFGLIVAICSSYIHVEIYFSRLHLNDLLYVKIKALYGMVRYQMNIPIIEYKSISEGVFVRSKIINVKKEITLNENKEHITKEKIVDFYEKVKLIAENTLSLYGWLKRTLKRMECTKLTWTTRVGIGDAPDTAIMTGIVWGMKSSLLGFIMSYVQMKSKALIEVFPQYNQPHFSTQFSCKFRIRIVYVLWAVFQLLIRIIRIKGGLRKWYRVFLKPKRKAVV